MSKILLCPAIRGWAWVIVGGKVLADVRGHLCVVMPSRMGEFMGWKGWLGMLWLEMYLWLGVCLGDGGAWKLNGVFGGLMGYATLANYVFCGLPGVVGRSTTLANALFSVLPGVVGNCTTLAYCLFCCLPGANARCVPLANALFSVLPGVIGVRRPWLIAFFDFCQG